MLDFQELLSLLAAEHVRVCNENVLLATENARLQMPAVRSAGFQEQGAKEITLLVPRGIDEQLCTNTEAMSQLLTRCPDSTSSCDLLPSESVSLPEASSQSCGSCAPHWRLQAHAGQETGSMGPVASSTLSPAQCGKCPESPEVARSRLQTEVSPPLLSLPPLRRRPLPIETGQQQVLASPKNFTESPSSCVRRMPSDASSSPPVQASQQICSSPARRPSFSSTQGHLKGRQMDASIDDCPLEMMLAGTSAPVESSLSRGASFRRFLAGSGVAGQEGGCVVNPEHSRFLQRWDTVTVVAMVFVALVTPVQVSMMVPDMGPFFYVNCAVDLVFVFDMVLQFFLMYPKRTTYGYTLEHRQSMIVRHYLRSWFSIDLMSVMPFDWMGWLVRSRELQNLKIVKLTRLLRLLKLVRVVRASRILRRLESRMSISYGKLGLIKFFAILAVITHWLANLWALNLVLVDEAEGVPRWIDRFEPLEVNVPAKIKDTPWKLYITCLYFTSYTITSVGYGDISPQNIVEIVVATIMLVVSGVSWAVVLGQVCGIVANLNPDEQAFRRTMDDLTAMMSDRAIPEPLRRRLRTFFLASKREKARTRHQHLIATMSPGLRGEVVTAINRIWIERVRFFQSLMLEDRMAPYQRFYALLIDLSQNLETSIHAQCEEFGEPHVLYILKHGLVSRRIIHRMGSVWGVDFLLSDARLIDSAPAMAITYAELSILRREVFAGLVERHKGTCPEIEGRIRYFVRWLAFQRAILLEAARRRSARRSTLSPRRALEMTAKLRSFVPEEMGGPEGACARAVDCEDQEEIVTRL